MKIGGTKANANAAYTTIGVYTRANLLINCSASALFAEAFSTRSRILATVEFSYALVTSTSSTALIFTQPLTICSPGLISRGILSPVIALVSKLEKPAFTIPSNGTRSPGLITMISPTCTSSGSTSSKLSPRFTLAYSGQISIKSLIDLRLLPTA